MAGGGCEPKAAETAAQAGHSNQDFFLGEAVWVNWQAFGRNMNRQQWRPGSWMECPGGTALAEDLDGGCFLGGAFMGITRSSAYPTGKGSR